MARKRDPVRDKAKKMWIASGKHKSLTDIAKELDKKPSQIRKWKSQDHWEENKQEHVISNVTNEEKERYYSKVTPINDKTDNLTPQQELFAQLVGGQRLPLYRAYQIAYSKTRPKVATAMSQGSRLSNQANIKSRILKISETSAAENEWSLSKVVESLSFIHDEAKASVIADGLKKANSDALLNSLDRLTQLLKLSEQSKSEIRKVNAEADVAEQKARDARSGGQDVGKQFDKMFERLKEDSDK